MSQQTIVAIATTLAVVAVEGCGSRLMFDP